MVRGACLSTLWRGTVFVLEVVGLRVHRQSALVRRACCSVTCNQSGVHILHKLIFIWIFIFLVELSSDTVAIRTEKYLIKCERCVLYRWLCDIEVPLSLSAFPFAFLFSTLLMKSSLLLNMNKVEHGRYEKTVTWSQLHQTNFNFQATLNLQAYRYVLLMNCNILLSGSKKGPERNVVLTAFSEI